MGRGLLTWSCGLRAAGAVAPGGGMVAAGAGLQAAVQDAGEAGRRAPALASAQLRGRDYDSTCVVAHPIAVAATQLPPRSRGSNRAVARARNAQRAPGV